MNIVRQVHIRKKDYLFFSMSITWQDYNRKYVKLLYIPSYCKIFYNISLTMTITGQDHIGNRIFISLIIIGKDHKSKRNDSLYMPKIRQEYKIIRTWVSIDL